MEKLDGAVDALVELFGARLAPPPRAPFGRGPLPC